MSHPVVLTESLHHLRYVTSYNEINDILWHLVISMGSAPSNGRCLNPKVLLNWHPLAIQLVGFFELTFTKRAYQLGQTSKCLSQQDPPFNPTRSGKNSWRQLANGTDGRVACCGAATGCAPQRRRQWWGRWLCCWRRWVKLRGWWMLLR